METGEDQTHASWRYVGKANMVDVVATVSEFARYFLDAAPILLGAPN
jgi:hypothetical protein